MKIEVTTDQRFKVRQATQVLGAITLLDDALAMTTESAAILRSMLDSLLPERNLGDELKDLGRNLLDPNTELNFDEAIDKTLMDLVIQTHVNTCALDDDLELLSLTEGSIRGVFRKIIEGGAKRVREALRAMKGALPTGSAPQLKADLTALIAEKQLSESARETSAGMLVIAAAYMRNPLVEMNAIGFIVEADDEDDDTAPAMAA